jgi:hypothetical protein
VYEAARWVNDELLAGRVEVFRWEADGWRLLHRHADT